MVYLAIANGAAKVGFTRWPRKRIQGLCSGSAVTMVRIVDGTWHDEQRIHVALASHRSGENEWYAKEPAIAFFAQFPQAIDPLTGRAWEPIEKLPKAQRNKLMQRARRLQYCGPSAAKNR